MSQLKFWVIEVLCHLGFSSYRNIEIPPLEKCPNILKCTDMIASCTNENQCYTALKFARLAIERDIEVPKYNKDNINIVLSERETMMQSLIHLSNITLNNIRIKNGNTKIEKMKQVLEHIQRTGYNRLEERNQRNKRYGFNSNYASD